MAGFSRFLKFNAVETELLKKMFGSLLNDNSKILAAIKVETI